MRQSNAVCGRINASRPQTADQATSGRKGSDPVPGIGMTDRNQDRQIKISDDHRKRLAHGRADFVRHRLDKATAGRLPQPSRLNTLTFQAKIGRPRDRHVAFVEFHLATTMPQNQFQHREGLCQRPDIEPCRHDLILRWLISQGLLRREIGVKGGRIFCLPRLLPIADMMLRSHSAPPQARYLSDALNTYTDGLGKGCSVRTNNFLEMQLSQYKPTTVSNMRPSQSEGELRINC